MTDKKYYISLFIIITLTIGLLSLSYSKNSDQLLSYSSDETTISNSRIIFSNKNIINLKNKETDISIINNSSEKQSYYLIITNLIGSNEEVLVNDEVYNINEEYSFELNPVGNENDHNTINIKTMDSEAYKINITTKKTNNLYNALKSNDEVYIDNNQNYRYFGENPQNYILYNNELYRIVGLIDNQIELISNSIIRKNFNNEIKYITINDYLLSFNNVEVNINNTRNYNTWLNQDNSFWLNDKDENNLVYIASKYRGIIKDYQSSYNAERNVIYISPKAIINKGIGTIDEPYEVVI